MKRTVPVSILLLTCRVLACAFLALAGASKLSNPQFFAASVQEFKILPRAGSSELADSLIVGLTFVVPWSEIICAALLLAGLWTRAAALVASALLGGFTIALVSVIVRKLNITCGCFGDIELFCGDKVTWCNVVRNGVFLGLTGLPLACGAGRFGLDARLARPEPQGRVSSRP